MFNYQWSLQDLKKVKPNGFNVFGTFICRGGSTMGYKLAGYNHLGGVEIDPRCAEIYQKNLIPKYLFLEDIRKFNLRNDLPEELYNLDILDGSPPCSSFSMAGNREKDWGKKKVFREGQANQTLDDLVFIYCDTIIKLQPKVAILENVSGMLKGCGKSYLLKIIKKLNTSNYDTQIFCLNASSMGVPQRRERVFVVCKRKDLKLPKLVLNFNQKPILYSEFYTVKPSNKTHTDLWQKMQLAKYGDKCIADINLRLEGRNSGFTHTINYLSNVLSTITSGGTMFCFETKDYIPDCDYITAGSFPQDYDFCGQSIKYYIGMSVPPLMTANIAKEIQLQLLTKL